ncbi:RNA polymerase sigma-70 factor [Persicitalea sp.]|uniref:RNA polymerase sigma-70 factor n=1 Tax=Persicitalea sp. TaxID=3100273 RepID=UPI0035946B26
MQVSSSDRFSDFMSESKLSVYRPADATANGEENASRPIPLDEEILIRKAFQSSPEEGCELLFRRYHRPLCSHALRFVYSPEVAEDIVSDVFCRFWKNSSFDSVSTSFCHYLFRSVRHAAYSHLRAEFRQLDSLESSKLPEGSAGLRPDHITQYEETFNRVKELVAQLPPQCRQVFLLSRFEGMRYKEIAAEMGLSVKTVDTHLAKAMSLMRQGMRDYLILSTGLMAMLMGNG